MCKNMIELIHERCNMRSFFRDLFDNTFGTTILIWKSKNAWLRNMLFLVLICAVIAIITWSISFAWSSKSNIIIEQIGYEEDGNYCSVTYSVKNNSKLTLDKLSLQYDVLDKNTGKIIYSQQEKMTSWRFSYAGDSDREYFSIFFNTIQTDNYGNEQITPYRDMVIKYKLIDVDFVEGVWLYLAKYMSLGFAIIPFAYYFGKFFFVVFPIVFYAYSFNIKNFFLRYLIRLLLLFPYILGGIIFKFQDPRNLGDIGGWEVAVDVNGKVVGSYNSKTRELRDRQGRIVVPTNKK